MIWNAGFVEISSGVPSVSTSKPVVPYLSTQAVSVPPASHVMSADDEVRLFAARLLTLVQEGAAPGV